jgi:membrane-associated phospholipid phosphatase
MKTLLKRFVDWIRKFLREKFHSQNENLPYYITILIALVVFLISLSAFIQLTDELLENDLGYYDETVTKFVIGFRTEPLTLYFQFMTDMGDRYAYVIITVAIGAYFFFRHRSWRFISQTVFVLILATLTNMLIKRLVNRSRPTLEHLVSVNTLSYPSGHSMSAMAFYGFLIYLVAVSKMKSLVRVGLVTILILIILSVGLSRIYLGVHFPTDVAAGYIGGLIWITLCIMVFNILEMWRKKRKNKQVAN